MTVLGKILQFVALTAVPVAILMQLGGMPVREMLILTVAAAAAFYLGRLIEGYGARR